MSPGPLRILVVNEDPHDVEHIKGQLAEGLRNGCGIDGALSFHEAAGRMAESRYDLYVFDYLLGERTGLDLLREHVRCPDETPTIVLTDEGDEETAVEAMRAGAADYLVRSRLSPELLRNSVRHALEIREKERQRLHAARALQASEEQYRLLFETNPLPMYVVCPEDLRFLAVNDASLRHYGYSRELFLAMTVSDLCAPDAAPALAEMHARLRAGGAMEGSTGVWSHRRHDGSWIEVELQANRLLFRGQPAFLMLANDVTERRRAQEALRRTEEQLRQWQKIEAVGRLAGGIAHDFNNLINVISGYGQILKRRLAPESGLERNVEEILNAAERGASLTRQLLAFSRKQQLEPKILDLNDVVGRTGEMLRRLIGEDVELVLVSDPDLGQIRADPGQVEQVLMNLVVNARDAMPAGGTLTIETANVELGESDARSHVGVRPGPHVLLAVSDTGTGMDADTQSHLFEPFFTTKAPGQGTGLGLATVYGIVQQSGGHIWVYSELGWGTTFKIYLPRVLEPHEARTGRVPPRGGNETVLLVEDEDVVRSFIANTLQSYGYTVLSARQGDEALRVATHHEGPIHLLLTDVVMPRMNGQELARRMASVRPEARILYVTGYTEDALWRHGITSQGAFLEKPFAPDELAGKVRSVLDA